MEYMPSGLARVLGTLVADMWMTQPDLFGERATRGAQAAQDVCEPRRAAVLRGQSCQQRALAALQVQQVLAAPRAALHLGCADVRVGRFARLQCCASYQSYHMVSCPSLCTSA